MKPVEPGCLALVVRDEDAGMVVTCTHYCPPGFVFRSPRGLRKTNVPAWETKDPDGVDSIRAEASLLRIDGGAESEERIAERKDQEVPA